MSGAQVGSEAGPPPFPTAASRCGLTASYQKLLPPPGTRAPLGELLGTAAGPGLGGPRTLS